MTAVAYAALWVFVFSIPWENIIVVPGVGAISRLAGIVAMGFAALAVMVSGRCRRWHPLHVAALLFLIWTSVGQMFFISDRLSHKYEAYIQLVLVMWMIWELAPSRQRQIGLLTAYVAGTYVAAFNTIMVYRRAGSAVRRFAAEGFDPNDLAMILSLALPMAWYLGMTYRQPLMRWFCRAYLPIGLVAVGLTGSRGGMLASMLGLLIVPLTMTKLSPSRVAAAMLMMSISAALAITYVPQTVVQRLASTGAQVEGGGLNGRWKIWVVAVQAFEQRPITGYGSGSFKGVAAKWLGARAQVAHNSYLSLLVEQGIVGFLLYSAMFISVFLALLKLPLLERRFTLVLMATLGLAMLPLSWEDHKAVWSILAILLGFAKAPVATTEEGMLQSPERRPTILRGVGVGSQRPERPTLPLRGAYRERTP